jgi:hypothetical protein
MGRWQRPADFACRLVARPVRKTHNCYTSIPPVDPRFYTLQPQHVDSGEQHQKGEGPEEALRTMALELEADLQRQINILTIYLFRCGYSALYAYVESQCIS